MSLVQSFPHSAIWSGCFDGSLSDGIDHLVIQHDGCHAICHQHHHIDRIGVSVDYSLFLVNRFREELNRGRDIRTSTAMTVATAGKAVFFSGVTVAIGLMGMLFFENTGLPSLGIGGTLAVTVAMIFSVIVLPAFMAILGPRVFTVKSLIHLVLKTMMVPVFGQRLQQLSWTNLGLYLFQHWSYCWALDYRSLR